VKVEFNVFVVLLRYVGAPQRRQTYIRRELLAVRTVAPPVKAAKPSGLFNAFLDVVEYLGNKLPDPLTLFTVFCVLALIGSYVAAGAGLEAVNPGTKEVIKAVNLLSGPGLVKILTGLVKNFTSFPPLGLVLVTMVGVGVADKSGLISALMRTAVIKAPEALIVPTIIFFGILGNAAGDSAFIVLPPIAAMVFLSLHRHPLAGMALAYAACAGGFSANVLITMTDALAAGFTQKAAQLIDPNFITNPANNWFFLIAATLVFTPLATWVNNHIVEPRLGPWQGESVTAEPLKAGEARGLKAAALATVLYVALLLLLTVPTNGLLRDPKTHSLVISPFMDSIIPITMFLFLIPGLAYGYAAGTIKSGRDTSAMISKALAEMGPFMALAFVAAQFLAFFQWSNLGPIIAIKGAEFLQNIGLTGLGLLIGFIVVSCLINILIASASAKWAILSPIFVPMFMLLGYHPAFTQLAYRIGDSITNPITPLLPYFPILLGFAQQYDEDLGMGTLISLLLPYTIFFAIFWILLFVAWFFLGLPLGPGAFINL